MSERKKNEDKYASLKLDNQLCFPLYAAARKITSYYTPLLKPLNLTYTQYIVMLVLWEEKSCTVTRLCSRLFLDSGTLSPLLKKLESIGNIEKIRSCNDERCVTVSLTEKGDQLKDDALNIPKKLSSCLSLPIENAEQLYKALRMLLAE